MKARCRGAVLRLGLAFACLSTDVSIGCAQSSVSRPICFETQLPEANGPIKRILLDMKEKSLLVEEWGMARARFVQENMQCKQGGSPNKWSCSVMECDNAGGGTSITRLGNGNIRLELEALITYLQWDSHNSKRKRG